MVPVSPLYFRKNLIRAPQVKAIIRKKDKLGRNLCYDDETGKRVACGGEPAPATKPTKTPKPKTEPEAIVEPKPKPVIKPKAPKVEKPIAKKPPAENKPPARKPKEQKPTVESINQDISTAIESGLTDEKLTKIVDGLSKMTVADLKQVRKAISAFTTGKLKKDIIENIRERIARINAGKPKPPEPENIEPVETTKPEETVPAETKPEEVKPEEKPVETPKPTERKPIQIDYMQKNPEHPVAKSIVNDTKAREVVESVLRHEEDFYATPEGQEYKRAKDISDKEAELWRKVKEVADKYGDDSPEIKQFRGSWLPLYKEKEKLKEVLKKGIPEIRETFKKAMKPKNPVKVNVKHHEGMKNPSGKEGWYIEPFTPNPTQEKAIAGAVDFLASVVEGGELDKETDVFFASSPDGRAAYTDSVAHDQAQQTGGFFGRLLGLKDYKPRPTIYLGDRRDVEDATAVGVHELGHYLETHKPGIKEKVKAFVEYRIGDEKAVDMESVGGAKGEMGRKDQFDRYFDTMSAYYVGRLYKNKKGEEFGSEILSMGIEALYRDSANFIKKDPEYAQFVISCLRA